MKSGMEIEWKWKGNGMENLCRKLSIESGMEIEWKWKGYGMERKREQ